MSIQTINISVSGDLKVAYRLDGREVELGGGDDLVGHAFMGPREARGGVDVALEKFESDGVRCSSDQRVGS